MINFDYYLDKPWEMGVYECWALVCDYYFNELGVELPVINLGTTDPVLKRMAFSKYPEIHNRFEKKLFPKHNDIVAMYDKNDKKKIMSHVGVYIETDEGAKVMHSTKSAGTLIQNLDDLDCGIIGFFRLVK